MKPIVIAKDPSLSVRSLELADVCFRELEKFANVQIERYFYEGLDIFGQKFIDHVNEKKPKFETLLSIIERRNFHYDFVIFINSPDIKGLSGYGYSRIDRLSRIFPPELPRGCFICGAELGYEEQCSVLLHELGHYYGLVNINDKNYTRGGHCKIKDCIMNDDVSGWDVFKRQLEKGFCETDANRLWENLRKIYPITKIYFLY